MFKVLVVNKKNPEKSQYIDHDKVGSYMLGRRISEYIVIITSDNASDVIVTFYSPLATDIQNKVNNILFGV